jgi:hypothetical protein
VLEARVQRFDSYREGRMAQHQDLSPLAARKALSFIWYLPLDGRPIIPL